jgi:integrase
MVLRHREEHPFMHAAPHQPASLHTPSGARKYLTADERGRFVAAANSAPPALRSFCLTLAWTGCRISEALALTLSSIDPESSSIAIHSLKKRRTGHVRHVPVPPSLISSLLRAHSNNGPQARLWPWSRSRAWQLIKMVMKEAEIGDGPHAMPKGLRHAFGLHAIRCGVPLPLVQRWLGHASLVTTAIYLQAIGREEQEFARRMWSRSSLDGPIQPPSLNLTTPSTRQ